MDFEYIICTAADNDYFSYLERLVISANYFAPTAKVYITLINVPKEKSLFLFKLNENIEINHEYLYFYSNEMKAGYCTNKRAEMMLSLLKKNIKPVIWIDADSVFTRSDRELVEILKNNDFCTILDENHPRLSMSKSQLNGIPHGPLKSPYYGIISAGVSGANSSPISIKLYEYINELVNICPYTWYTDQEALYLGYLKYKDKLNFGNIPHRIANEGDYTSLICFAKGQNKSGPFKEIGDSLIWKHFNLIENIEIQKDKINKSKNPITNIKINYKIKMLLKNKLNSMVESMLRITKLKGQPTYKILNAAKWYFTKSIPFKNSFKTKIRDFNLYLDTKTPGISKTLAIHKEREQDMVKILERVLKPGMNVLDCGSNIGYYPLLQMSIMKNSGKIICVEPDPRNFKFLKKNILKSPIKNNFSIYHAAVSDINSKLSLNLSTHSNLNKINRSPDLNEGYEINSFTVDSILQNEGCNIDLIRMDIEGHEVEVLRGAREFLKNAKTGFMLFFELHPNEYSIENSLKVELQYLFNNGYRCDYLVSASTPLPSLYAKLGYSPHEVISTDNLERGFYTNIENNNHIIELATSQPKASRYILLRKENEIR